MNRSTHRHGSARAYSPAIRKLAMLAALGIAYGCGPAEVPNQHASSQRDAKVPRVAILVFGSRDAAPVTGPSSAAELLRKRMSELGHVDGKSVRIEERYAEGDPQRLAQLAQETVATRPDVIVAMALAAATAARRATATIPIVMVHAGSPVEAGLVTSLANPGGNVTGTTSMVPDLGIKQIEVLRELIPGLRKLGVLANPTNLGASTALTAVREAARSLDLEVVVAHVTRNEDLDAAFRKLGDARPDALLVMVEPLIGMNRSRIIDFAAAHRIPTSFDVGREFVRSGGLVSYGPVLSTDYLVVAEYVDKILKGAKPGDLPVHQPTQLALVINLGTAKALGLTIPQAMLLRADEVIQ
jgi:putative ABC transport system substrate-binding protein